ncbi:hypothetical protein ACF1FX_01795 [Streptomyces sp. NPDC014646]|uniref:hypothetical protein n=1 Tax=Streptomyces sp. NPDC014646 TaxID=3364877 RepID=UPI0036FD2FC4
MDRSTEFVFGVPGVMSFFHQDWRLGASTEAEAVAGRFVEEPDAVLPVRRDALLLHDGLPHDGLPHDRITVLREACADIERLLDA